MKYSDWIDFMHSYLANKFPQGTGWEIEMTSKKRKDAKWGDIDHENGYTLIIYDKKAKVPIMKSVEIRGYNKSRWSAVEYGEFLATLEVI